ncbi:unnamed protein product [Phytomonas sp. EM1]|nr:unnamed protein product [Phytomonas sp. EM1]|eukprot:CCW63721.1 unnamed protein product [Phytomonas sp. isolate EM1]
MSLVEEVKTNYHLVVSPEYVERARLLKNELSAVDVFQMALTDDLKKVNHSSTLPFGIASQTNSSIPYSVVLQVKSARDATQALRPCLDSADEEDVFNSVFQKTTNHRLLRLVLTDGYTDIPAIELSTLSIFKGIPVPGEKILVKGGSKVLNGSIIMVEDSVIPLGGEVKELKQEYLAQRRRVNAGCQVNKGLEGAPCFVPLQTESRFKTHSSGESGERYGHHDPSSNRYRPSCGRGRGNGTSKNQPNHKFPSHRKAQNRDESYRGNTAASFHSSFPR